MEYTNLGSTGLKVSRLGFGGIPIQRITQEEATALIHKLPEYGVNYIDTARGYTVSEEYLGIAMEGIRDKFVLATKSMARTKEAMEKDIETSLKNLRTDHIDLYYQHRVDPNVPIETVAETVGELIREGKVLHWGLSEAAASTVRHAHAVCPLTAVQSEYSLWYRKPEEELLPTLEELGIGFVPFSPLGKAMLTGRFNRDTKFDKSDFRSAIPRFQGENLKHNMELVEYVEELAQRKQTTPARIAIGWLLAQRPWIVPIPGTKRIERIEENIGGEDIRFTSEELADIRRRLDRFEIRGGRYPEDQERMTGL